jgi:hypothetical protein
MNCLTQKTLEFCSLGTDKLEFHNILQGRLIRIALKGLVTVVDLLQENCFGCCQLYEMHFDF